MRAANAIYEVEEGRSFLHKRPLQLAITVVLLAMVGISAIAVVVTGGLAQRVGVIARRNQQPIQPQSDMRDRFQIMVDLWGRFRRLPRLAVP